MNTKTPSEKLEHLANVFFGKKNQRVDVTGFNSECIMEVRYEIKNGKYKIITDDFQKITKQKYKKLLERFENGEDIAPVMGEDIWAGNSTRKILDLDKTKSHRLYDKENRRHYFSTASRI